MYPRQGRESLLDLSYGSHPAERLDVFFPDLDVSAPVVVMVHGGGWRSSSKEARAFPADLYCPAGAVYVTLEYPLAPEHALDTIVDFVQRGVAWVAEHARNGVAILKG